MSRPHVIRARLLCVAVCARVGQCARPTKYRRSRAVKPLSAAYELTVSHSFRCSRRRPSQSGVYGARGVAGDTKPKQRYVARRSTLSVSARRPATDSRPPWGTARTSDGASGACIRSTLLARAGSSSRPVPSVCPPSKSTPFKPERARYVLHFRCIHNQRRARVHHLRPRPLCNLRGSHTNPRHGSLIALLLLLISRRVMASECGSGDTLPPARSVLAERGLPESEDPLALFAFGPSSKARHSASCLVHLKLADRVMSDRV